MGKRKNRKNQEKKTHKLISSMEAVSSNMDAVPEFSGGMKFSKKMKKAFKRNKLMRSKMWSVLPTPDFDSVLYNQTDKTSKKTRKKLQKKLQMAKFEEGVNRHENQLKTGTDRGFLKVIINTDGSEAIEKDFLFTSLRNYLISSFVPLGFFRETKSVSFYVEADHSLAENFKSLDKKLQSPNGSLLEIKMEFVKETNFILNCNQLETLKAVLESRYDVSNRVLNLSAFHLDSKFLESSTFVPLSNKQIFRQILKLIGDNMPDITGVDLSNNRLWGNALKILGDNLRVACKSLSAINLAQNNIEDTNHFKCLDCFPLRELVISSNIFNAGFVNTPQKFIRSIKKQLPFLKMLDGREMKAEATPSLDITKCLSNMSVSNSADDSSVSESFIKTFLEQYYSLFDDYSSREELLSAYTPNAEVIIRSSNSSIPSGSFNGQSEIVVFLKNWPRSIHDHSSFQLNILTLTNSEGSVQIDGCCHFSEQNSTFRFKRTMSIVPYNSGFCCSKDVFDIEI